MGLFAPAMRGHMQSSYPPRRHRGHPWLSAIGFIILAVIVLSVIGSLNGPTTVTCTPPQCVVPPPRTRPIPLPNRYTSATYGFSLDYSTTNITPSNISDAAISWDGQLQDGSEVAWSFNGARPNGRNAQQIVNQVQQSDFGDATYAYTIPHADLGYTPGYGNVYDVTVAPGGGAAVHQRVIIIAAIKRGVAVVLEAMGPFQQTSPQTDGHPNPADTPMVNLGDFDETIKSVVWAGDQPL